MNSLWSKVCITAALSLVALSASAQNLTIEEKVAKKFKNIERLTLKLERQSLRQTKLQLRQLNKQLATVVAALKADGDVVDYPPVDPIPVPPVHNLISVTGTIEGTPYMFQVVDAMDLVHQCESAGTPSKVDDMTVSVDFSQSAQMRNSASWWVGEKEICRILAKKAVDLGLIHVPTQISGYEVIGMLESTPFVIQGYTLSDFMFQCMSFHAANNMGKIDDIIIYDDLEIIKKKNSASWWSNSNQVCNVIIDHIK